MSSRKNPRQTARWQRIREAIGTDTIHAANFNPDEHADLIYRVVMGRPKWNRDEELAEELADSLADARRRKKTSHDARRRAKAKERQSA